MQKVVCKLFVLSIIFVKTSTILSVVKETTPMQNVYNLRIK